MRNRYVLGCDCVAFALACYGAFALRFDLLAPRYRDEFLPFLVASLLVKPFIFYGMGMYRRFWRYASLQDLLALIVAVSTGSVVLSVVIGGATVSRVLFEFSRAVIVNDWLLTIFATAGIRISLRVIGESRQRSKQATRPGKRVLIVGAGNAGTMVVEEMHRNPQLGMTPVGFLDDDPVKFGKRIHGVPVLGSTDEAERVLELKAVDEALIAMPAAAGAELRRVTARIQKANVPSRILPGVFELLDGNISVTRLRHVEIADLLRRTQFVGDLESHEYLAGSTVMVTGGGGSIGLELCRQVAHARPTTLVVLGHGENSVFEATVELRTTFPSIRTVAIIADIRDSRRLRQVFEHTRPSVVFHAAAHKHVPLMEENVPEAITNNILGTHNVVQCALHAGTERLVLVSTDKAVAPASIMGASKRVAEMIVRDAARESGRAFVIVRFGNVLGSRGSVVPVLKQQIHAGGPVRITHAEMKRFFMTIPEAVHLTMQAGGMGRGGELFVLKMGEPVRILDLAKDLISLSGLATDDIPIVFTGVRPGEKLEEALWEADANLEATTHPDVLCVTEPSASRAPVCWATALPGLAELADRNDRSAIDSTLADWVPSYTPSWMREALTSIVPQV
jgi:FlaA1/EpsC-like NDP-sugar epimerase